MDRVADPSDADLPPGVVPPGTTELGIDIIKVERIRATLERFGPRFAGRVLTDTERRYVRDRPEKPSSWNDNISPSCQPLTTRLRPRAHRYSR